MSHNFRTLIKLIPQSIKELNSKNPLQLASSTAFFSILAIPPILVILISVLGLFVKPDYLNSEIFGKISAIMGNTSSQELKKLFISFNDLSDDTWTSVGVFAFLLFIATNLFFLLELNINQIWDIPSQTNESIIQHLYGRLTSILLLLIGGAVLILALLLEIGVSYIDDQITYLIPNLKAYILPLISQTFSLLTFGIWFTLLFKILPNAKLKWKVAMVGGVFMAILFKLGQLVISNILINGSIKSVFSASGSIVLVMLFIFYTSFIFYFVAMFLKKYAASIGKPIKA